MLLLLLLLLPPFHYHCTFGLHFSCLPAFACYLSSSTNAAFPFSWACTDLICHLGRTIYQQSTVQPLHCCCSALHATFSILILFFSFFCPFLSFFSGCCSLSIPAMVRVLLARVTQLIRFAHLSIFLLFLLFFLQSSIFLFFCSILFYFLLHFIDDNQLSVQQVCV